MLIDASVARSFAVIGWTRHLLGQLVAHGIVAEADARAMYHCLQTDELHNLGGPPWIAATTTTTSGQPTPSSTS